MSEDDQKLAAFFARPNRWQAELAALRAIALGAGLTEEFKWRGPCYTHAGGNVAILGGFKDYCALTFFKGVLLHDPKTLLVPPGDHSRIARVFRVTEAAQITAAAGDLTGLIARAMQLEREGTKVDLPKEDIALPPELATALQNDAELARAYEALTPGRQRGWALTIAQPKQAATRLSRIEKARPRILAGKGIHDR